ncbi:bifunctional folylpolyglutamate synthase/dihydrofolate synthase [Alicyclobacillus dauci]|uniref:tetrahydrofolate synthase n=1 Tax=Alicyclobacillus dauci TaxID=1475485 RepID=A0ABY6Z7S9_9BACL|nr:folylpolyglutamate synthase/dihydrofolate synthase family protein [Alicyclobacillus dauci]WAH38955.1 bifunctional folylpolyglutamate synthase/dihydrofolate synthase [Alicyclobacillus dauci]
MDIEEANEWIGSLRRFGIKPGLERVLQVLERLSNPQDGLVFYHVAGTNGKGSVCAMLTRILQACGTRVGVYTSPGLSGFNGRMVIDNEPISDIDFAKYAVLVKDAQNDLVMTDPLTEFEVLTIMALLYFRDAKVDTVVWETGLGGRFDATNVVRPSVTAITNVSYDHVEILGPRLTDIAFDKAGIVKPGIPIVTAADGEAYRIIEQVATEVSAPVIRVGRDVSMVATGSDHFMQHGAYRGLYRDAGHVLVSLYGQHQLKNAAVALAMFETQHPHLDVSSWRKAVDALASVVWPMRFEVLEGENGPIVIDGAHNPDAAAKLAMALDDFASLHSSPRNWRMLIGVLGDKDVRPMLQIMLPRADEVIVCRPNHIRGGDPETVGQMVRELSPDLPVTVISDVEEATREATKNARALVIWGSLYMVEDARKAISKLGLNYRI